MINQLDDRRNSLATASKQIDWNYGGFFQTGLGTPKPGKINGNPISVPPDLVQRRLYALVSCDVADTGIDFFLRMRVVGLLRAQEVFSLPLEITNSIGNFTIPISLFEAGGYSADSVLIVVPAAITQETDRLKRLNPLRIPAVIDSLRMDLVDSSDNSNGNNWPTVIFGFLGCLSTI